MPQARRARRESAPKPLVAILSIERMRAGQLAHQPMAEILDRQPQQAATGIDFRRRRTSAPSDAEQASLLQPREPVDQRRRHRPSLRPVRHPQGSRSAEHPVHEDAQQRPESTRASTASMSPHGDRTWTQSLPRRRPATARRRLRDAGRSRRRAGSRPRRSNSKRDSGESLAELLRGECAAPDVAGSLRMERVRDRSLPGRGSG